MAGKWFADFPLPAIGDLLIRIAARWPRECPASEIRAGFCGATRALLRPGASARFELADGPRSRICHRIARRARAAHPPEPVTRTRRRATQKRQLRVRPSAYPE